MIIEAISLIRKSNKEVIFRVTTEERRDGVIISTYWEASDGPELNAHVKEYETVSGAMLDMYRNAISYMGVMLLDKEFDIEVYK